MEEILVGDVTVSILRVVVHKPALYTCQATNQHSGGINTVKATAKITVSGKSPHKPPARINSLSTLFYY